jgi:hypothetical protein
MVAMPFRGRNPWLAAALRPADEELVLDNNLGCFQQQLTALTTKIASAWRPELMSASWANSDKLVIGVEDCAFAVRSAVVASTVEQRRRDFWEHLTLLERLENSREG